MAVIVLTSKKEKCQMVHIFGGCDHCNNCDNHYVLELSSILKETKSIENDNVDHLEKELSKTKRNDERKDHIK